MMLFQSCEDSPKNWPKDAKVDSRISSVKSLFVESTSSILTFFVTLDPVSPWIALSKISGQSNNNAACVGQNALAFGAPSLVVAEPWMMSKSVSAPPSTRLPF